MIAHVWVVTRHTHRKDGPQVDVITVAMTKHAAEIAAALDAGEIRLKWEPIAEGETTHYHSPLWGYHIQQHELHV